jgi:AcrR family transcriptional regulator
MGVQERRARERAERHRAILDAARELAESEGWEAVTTRRLADRIEYSQPVLYSHFAGKGAIVAGIAIEGFAELAQTLSGDAGAAPHPSAALEAAIRAYLDFADRHPAVYEAMFTLADLPFADTRTPQPLRDGFAALRHVLEEVTGSQDIDLRTELAWSALHGLATLTRGGRLPARDHERRVELLLAQLQSGPTSGVG